MDWLTLVQRALINKDKCVRVHVDMVKGECMCECVCVRVSVCVCTCVRACVCMCVKGKERMCLCTIKARSPGK